MNTEKGRMLSIDEFYKLDSKWYKPNEIVPPEDENVLVTVMGYEYYFNNLPEKESFKKIQEKGVIPSQRGANINTTDKVIYYVTEAKINNVSPSFDKEYGKYNSYYWMVSNKLYTGRIIAWMPKPEIEPFKDAEFNIDSSKLKDEFLSISEKIIDKAKIIYK
jgi:hypothetical protein